MRIILLLIAVFFSQTAFGLSLAELRSKYCAGAAENRMTSCGVTPDSVSYDTTTQQISATTSEAVSATSPLYAAFVADGDPTPSRAFFYTSEAQKLTSLTQTIMAPAGVLGRMCTAQSHHYKLGEPICTANFTKAVAGSLEVTMNYGVYVSNGSAKFDAYQNPNVIRNRLMASQVCQNPNVKGIMLRLDGWGLFERYPRDSEGNISGPIGYQMDILDDNIAFLKGAECNAARGANNKPYYILSFYNINFGGSAGRKECVPEDVKNTEAFTWVKPANNAARCMSNYYDFPTLKTRFYDAIEFLALRYRDDPLLEGFNIKGESTFGLGNPSELPTSLSSRLELIKADYYDVMEEGIRRWNQHAPNKVVTMGYNNWGGSAFQSQGNTPESLALIARFTALCDELGACGFAHPDSFNSYVGTQGRQPVTQFFALAHSYRVTNTPPRQARWAVHSEVQIQTNRCNAGSPQGAVDCWNIQNNPTFTHTRSDFDVSYMLEYPTPLADNYMGLATSHSIWPETGANSYPIADQIAAWVSGSYEVYQGACPKSIVDSGATCITGEQP